MSTSDFEAGLNSPVQAGEHMRKTMNYDTVLIEPGHCILEGTPQDRHRNLDGVIHGGWFLTILDSALGSAVLSKQGLQSRTPSITLECKFIRPAAAGRTYRAESWLVNLGRTIGQARAELTDVETGKIIASATGTFAIIDRK